MITSCEFNLLPWPYQLYFNRTAIDGIAIQVSLDLPSEVKNFNRQVDVEAKMLDKNWIRWVPVSSRVTCIQEP